MEKKTMQQRRIDFYQNEINVLESHLKELKEELKEEREMRRFETHHIKEMFTHLNDKEKEEYGHFLLFLEEV
ncbi:MULTISPECIES: hypothetical protein [Arcobacteraceae]|uniref:Uncharacterized protein n=2 Tax=Aliarcobacter thereius TaxID=544718 RepID=A0A1C0B9M5_9BACT|nr:MULTISPECIES: hypothetical protein [Arcobacteraceae]OCL84599.1 hypothetical protein AAW29_00273 [Arcobacter porcinus]OCL94848.1 hypothetical protein AA347_00288 [Aliarcobacter thereius LMG 24486]OCM00295.1 hypothetical protein AAX29_00294 [Aliarcobacter thereius]QBF15278.1 hypothetical protein ATH_0187 [Aliarcobacter thereius LMG 24486]TLS92017.1 hypothetical protein FE244_07800 [Aliarcobacter thereius]